VVVIEVETSKEALAKLAKEIGEKVVDEFMRFILSKLTGEVIELRKNINDLKKPTGFLNYSQFSNFRENLY